MKTTPLILSALAAASLSTSVSALNIVLTNDDGYSTSNIQTLYSALTSAGHSVVVSAPCTGQSGKGGAIAFMSAVNVEQVDDAGRQFCVGDTDETVAFEDFVEGTPVMASLYGIDVLATKTWGSAPDLVIAGPNEGNNLGYLTNNSGTLGATNVAIARGIPAIAISAADADEEKATLVADAVVDIVAELVDQQAEGEPLLPRFTGLNVNTPEDMANNQGYAFAQVGWNPGGYSIRFVEDLSQDETVMGYVASSLMAAGYYSDYATAYAAAQAMYSGQGGGISFGQGYDLDDGAHSEGNLLTQGYITISTIEANVQATRAKDALTQNKLNGLVE